MMKKKQLRLTLPQEAIESVCQKCQRISLEDFVSQLDPRNYKRTL
jgi:hypothetical protein